MGILCLQPFWVLQSSPLLQPQRADLQFRTRTTSTNPFRAGLSFLPFPTTEPNRLESLSHPIASYKEGRKLLPEGFPSFLYPPQAATTTRDLAQTPRPRTAVGGHEGEGQQPLLSGLHSPQSLPQGAHRHISSSPDHLPEAFWLPPLARWKM